MEIGWLDLLLEHTKNFDGKGFFLQGCTFVDNSVMLLFFISGNFDGIQNFVPSCDFSIMERNPLFLKRLNTLLGKDLFTWLSWSLE
jgi:hypothetical protein